MKAGCEDTSSCGRRLWFGNPSLLLSILNTAYYLYRMHRWLRYGTPNESIFSQLLRLCIALILIGIAGVGIGLILKFVSTLYQSK
jgi:hypothetical protein